MVEQLIDELVGAKFFSKVDLRASYHQLQVAEEDVYKCNTLKFCLVIFIYVPYM